MHWSLGAEIEYMVYTSDVSFSITHMDDTLCSYHARYVALPRHKWSGKIGGPDNNELETAVHCHDHLRRSHRLL